MNESMTKQDFITLADRLRGMTVPPDVLEALIAFMRGQNPMFNEERWRDYLAGTHGPSGGLRRQRTSGIPRGLPQTRREAEVEMRGEPPYDREVGAGERYENFAAQVEALLERRSLIGVSEIPTRDDKDAPKHHRRGTVGYKDVDIASLVPMRTTCNDCGEHYYIDKDGNTLCPHCDVPESMWPQFNYTPEYLGK